MRKIIPIAIIILLISLTGCSLKEQTTNQILDAKESAKFIEKNKPIIVDIRTKEEFEKEHIENAININFYDPEFFTNMKKLPQQRPILIYCRSGHRSALAIKGLEGEMKTELYELKGGILNWIEKGYPTTTSNVESKYQY